jgi:clorobiocin biosynthesis protein CloN5
VPRPRLSERDLAGAILDHVRTRALRGDPLGELTDTTPLLEHRLLNSIRIAELLVFLREDLGVDADGLGLIPADFATVRNLARALSACAPID